MKIETLAVHAGRHPDPATGAIASPIYLSSTYERDADGRYPRGFSYSRENNPNRRSLEQCLAALEGGKDSLAFSSGLAAVAAVIQGLEPGDHILASDDVYYGVRRVIHEVYGKWPIETSYADFSSIDSFRAALRPNTRLVWFETPSNPLLKIIDLGAIGEIARATKAITVCDSTFATPVLQRPLDHSIDMVMHSTTKYINGHSDSLGGALITRHDNYLFERARRNQRVGGAVPSPMECWLTLRGIETLPWRVRAQSAHALEVARYLAGHPKVERVYYPGLETHPGHALAARQMSAFGGMLSFQVRGGEPEAMAAVARARLFLRATSLGGTHSLIEHRASVEGPSSTTPRNLIRTSIGLEHPADLIDDLTQALA
ncbi:MAG: aminotransferase class I/II-fold pyridoxal phosphate-dependent enzyme [Bryobacteraceae bacterium]